MAGGCLQGDRPVDPMIGRLLHWLHRDCDARAERHMTWGRQVAMELRESQRMMNELREVLGNLKAQLRAAKQRPKRRA